MLEDPPVNFAISTRGNWPGIDHLGFQTDDAAELAALKARAEAANLALLDEGTTTCCHARSGKHWVADPQGQAWEHFHTLGNIPVFNEAVAAAASAAACCVAAPQDQPRGKPLAAPVKSSSCWQVGCDAWRLRAIGVAVAACCRLCDTGGRRATA